MKQRLQGRLVEVGVAAGTVDTVYAHLSQWLGKYVNSDGLLL